MTSREPDTPLHRLLSRHYAELRRALVLREGLRAGGRAAAIVAAGLALGVAHPTGEALAWARLLAALAFVTAILVFAVASFLRARPSFDAFLERVEQRFPAVRSWLRNALDFERRPPAHTSLALADAVARETAQRLAGLPLASLRPAVEPRRPLAFFAASLALAVVLALVLPGRTGRSWHTFLDPRAAAPPVRLEVEPGSVTLTPGVALAVRAHVWGTAARPRLLRDRVPALEATPEGEGGSGERLWRFDLAQLTRVTDYRVRVAGVVSPLYHIGLAGTPQPVSFEVEIHPPAYARLPVQRGAATRGDLSALRGSRAIVEVLFDRDLESLEARAPGAPPRAWTPLNPRRWRGEIAVREGGEYELLARAGAAAGVAGEGRYRYRIQPLADAPPILTVRVPEGDLDLPAGQQVPYEVLGQDDLGLTELRLEVRKDAAAPWASVPLARFKGEPREVQVAQRWDASSLGLLPGESATFRFQLFDDNAVDGRGVATSPTFELRFPSLAELYQSVDQRQGSVQDALQKVADQARELQKSIDKLALPSPTPPSPATQNFVRQEEVKSALDRQQDLSRQIDTAARQLRESLEQAAERRAFDEQLTRKLRELAEVMDQIQSKELRESLRRLEEAMANLPQRPASPGLQDWQRQNQQMLTNLERTIELLKQLRQEERLQALAQRAQDLKSAQDELNRRAEDPRANDAARQSLAQDQKDAGAKSEQLARDAEQLAREVSEPQAGPALQDAADDLEQQAAPAQQEAAQAMQQGQRPQAREAGRRASQSLQRAAQKLGQIATSIQQNREQLDVAAVRRSAEDLLSLQRSAEANLSPAAPAGDRADRQQDLSEGTARVADSLAKLAERTPFISRKLNEALGRAMTGLQQSSRELAQGDRADGEAQGRGAASALVEAVLELRKSENSMCQRPGQGQPGGTVPMRMSNLGDNQNALNDRTRSLAQRLSQEARLSAGDRDEVQRLADEQARLQRELEQIAQDDQQRRQLLGRLGQTSEEMKQVEEALRQGDLGDEVQQQQQHILSRLLDAQRSVNRQDYDPRRESRPGEDVARSSPPPIPADLLRETDRLRLDLLKAQADRYPAQYRAFIEAYLRALNGEAAR